MGRKAIVHNFTSARFVKKNNRFIWQDFDKKLSLGTELETL
jgi:hypothetical protein